MIEISIAVEAAVLIGVVWLFGAFLLYLSRGIFGKFVFWGGGLTAVVTYYLYGEYDFSGWQGIAIVAAVPTCCLFWNCYDYAERLFPELGDIFRFISGSWKKMKVFVVAVLK